MAVPKIICSIVFFYSFLVAAQTERSHWVDSIVHTLSVEEKIAQLIVVRAFSNNDTSNYAQVTAAIRKYNIGGLCFFQGTAPSQALRTNFYQSIAKTPLLITTDAEWGLGMRLADVMPLPKALTLGALSDSCWAYEYGQIIGKQCAKMGIHLNFAPVVDINLNAENPVINDRSFGDNKRTVTRNAIQYLKGMQYYGVLGCAKHFPGHGDVNTDSHLELPTIFKSIQALDSVEWYPYQQLIQNHLPMVMVGHLAVKSVDSALHRPASLSRAVLDVLKNKLHFKGLTITDALEMKGVSNYFSDGAAAAEALLAGNDLVCLPLDLPAAIATTLQYIKLKKITEEEIDLKLKKLLSLKYDAGLHRRQWIDTTSLLSYLNGPTSSFIQRIAQNAETLVQYDSSALSIGYKNKKIAFIGLGLDSLNQFATRIKQRFKADVYFYNYLKDIGTIPMLIEVLKTQYDAVIIGVHAYNRKPANCFGISAAALMFTQQIYKTLPAISFVFGNPYALKYFKASPTLIACFEDTNPFQQAVEIEPTLFQKFNTQLPIHINFAH